MHPTLLFKTLYLRIRTGRILHLRLRQRANPASPPERHAVRHTARAAHLLFFVFGVFGGALRARHIFVSEHQQGWGIAVVAVDVLVKGLLMGEEKEGGKGEAILQGFALRFRGRKGRCTG